MKPPETPRPSSVAASASLDLDRPPTVRASATPAPVSTSLDLDSPPPPSTTTQPAPVSTSLDLDRPPPPSTTTPAGPPVPSRPVGPPARPAYPADTIRGRQRRILTAHKPTVTLNRVQSGVGTLSFEAAASAGPDHLRLGCLYELRSGWSSTVQRADGNREGPRHSSRPVIVGHREQFEQLSVDLRQAADLRRMTVYLYAPTGAALPLSGTFLVSTFGGASIEVPLDLPASAPLLAVMSVYNISGELVLRAEMEPITGSVRDIGRAYGYEQITWIDDRTPTD